jgi:hypothetical protein
VIRYLLDTNVISETARPVDVLSSDAVGSAGSGVEIDRRPDPLL